MRTLVPGAGLLALLTGSLAALAGCSEPAAAGCLTDADCPAGRSCAADGSCGAPGQQGGGGAGGEPGVDACLTSADCLDGPFPAIPTIFWDGSLDGLDPVCTVPERACPTGSRCEVATVCAPAPDGATRLGGMRCERDEQCAAGRCLAIAEGVSICLRSCAGDGDCPVALPREGGVLFEPTGLSCGHLEERGIGIDLCLPIDAAQPSRTLCANDCQCSPSDDCPEPPPGGLRCRFDGAQHSAIRALPLCEAVGDPAAYRATTMHCSPDPDECLGGACVRPCHDGATTDEGVCAGIERCSQACISDFDCPARTVCAAGYLSERIGSWMLPGQSPTQPGREVRYCQLPREGCFDEVDCCPVPDGAGGCTRGWSVERARCTVTFTLPEERPRLLTRCVLPPEPGTGPGAPGDCCTGHDGCDSNLCVPARGGTACAGSGVCSVPCDPDPEWMPGPEDDQDRCALSDFGASTYHLGSTCLPFSYRHPYTDPSGEPTELVVEIKACQ